MAGRNERNVPGFYGQYDVTVLGDGRIRLPGDVVCQLAAHHVKAIWLSKLPGERAIVLCPEDYWGKWVKSMRRRLPCLRTPEGIRVYLGPSRRVRPDAKGRVLLPTQLAAYAMLEAGHLAVLVGMDKYFEAWSQKEFNERSPAWGEKLRNTDTVERT